MNSRMVFILVGCLLWAGIPSSSRAGAKSDKLSLREKTTLAWLSGAGLLRQKTGDDKVPVNDPSWDKKPSDETGVMVGLGVVLVAIAIGSIILFSDLNKRSS